GPRPEQPQPEQPQPEQPQPEQPRPDSSAENAGSDDPEADPENVARTIALRKLTASARTRHELDQAMQRKNVPDEVASAVLDRLEAVGLVDDGAFAQGWVESRQQRRHLSRSALRRELLAKGVDRDHVDAALDPIDTDDELAAARALAAKKAAAGHRLDPAVRYRRVAGALARRGFGAGVITTVLSELRDNAGDSSW
ncbi:MAG: recombination regulator RecX, partial [Microlunatus sp.]|nr:recombination regulator RecX [Microlunatus sp.]